MAQDIIGDYHAYLNEQSYPCAGAKAAQANHRIHCLVACDLGDAVDDASILQFLYEFTDRYRNAKSLYHSAVILFRAPLSTNEEVFDRLLWQRLQALNRLDATRFAYDPRVDPDPQSPNFSYSLKEEAFFVVGMHAGSSRAARRFRYPALAFNPHQQFEQLRMKGRYDALKTMIRKRDVEYSGSVNPMLDDFSRSSEVYQYSGMQYPDTWSCPLIIHHGKHADHSTA